MQNKRKTESGFIILGATIILGAVGTVMGLSLAFVAITSSQNSVIIQQSMQARYLADACAESALTAIKQNENYSGGETVVIHNRECTIGAITTNGNEYTIPSSATVDTVTRKVKVIVNRTTTLNPEDPLAPETVSVTMGSWQEVSDF